MHDKMGLFCVITITKWAHFTWQLTKIHAKKVRECVKILAKYGKFSKKKARERAKKSAKCREISRAKWAHWPQKIVLMGPKKDSSALPLIFT